MKYKFDNETLIIFDDVETDRGGELLTEMKQTVKKEIKEIETVLAEKKRLIQKLNNYKEDNYILIKSGEYKPIGYLTTRERTYKYEPIQYKKKKGRPPKRAV